MKRGVKEDKKKPVMPTILGTLLQREIQLHIEWKHNHVQSYQ